MRKNLLSAPVLCPFGFAVSSVVLPTPTPNRPAARLISPFFVIFRLMDLALFAILPPAAVCFA
jgi:hypothetical protein